MNLHIVLQLINESTDNDGGNHAFLQFVRYPTEPDAGTNVPLPHQRRQQGGRRKMIATLRGARLLQTTQQ
jgi:hypothetical protein